MDLRNLAIFNMASRRMSWLGKRQEVLAHNIANSATPSYRPQDLKAQNFSKFLSPTAPWTPFRTTQANHIQPPMSNPEFRQDKEKNPYEVAPAGNAVVIEEQLMKVTETQGDYQLVTNLYQKHLKMIKIALGTDKR
jgi:flagellar basal-body rod protein FlgB